MPKIQRVDREIVFLPEADSVGIVGDPGCEGLGTYNMKVYAGALEKSAQDSVTLVVGDLVPAGNAHFYREISGLTEIVAQNDVYALRGNHDTGEYCDFFGRKNYCLLLKEFALVVIDNAQRYFEGEGLLLLARVLERSDVERVAVAFHIPVPNRFIRNSVSEAEFERLRAAYAGHRDKVKYFLCGHIHSRFEDVVDGIPLICTGGAGARIEDVSEGIRACDVEHHIVHLWVENGVLVHRFEDLGENCYARERADRILREELERTVVGELKAHLNYLMYAGRAQKRGFARLAALFRALAESEFVHARNFLAAAELPKPFSECPAAFEAGEKFEYEKSYRMLADYAAETGAPIARQAYAGAAAAERVHAGLLEGVKNAVAPEGPVYVCPICGYVMTGEVPERCPVCGGPSGQFETY